VTVGELRDVLSHPDLQDAEVVVDGCNEQGCNCTDLIIGSDIAYDAQVLYVVLRREKR